MKNRLKMEILMILGVWVTGVLVGLARAMEDWTVYWMAIVAVVPYFVLYVYRERKENGIIFDYMRGLVLDNARLKAKIEHLSKKSKGKTKK